MTVGMGQNLRADHNENHRYRSKSMGSGYKKYQTKTIGGGHQTN